MQDRIGTMRSVTLSRRAALIAAATATGALLDQRAVNAFDPAQEPAIDGYLYTMTNNIDPGENAVVGYAIASDRTMHLLAQGPVKTGGTGLNNGYIPGVNHGNDKSGPFDSDSPMATTPDRRFLYVVNAGSDTVAGFAIGPDGALSAVPGSPFPSRGVMPNSVSVSKDGARLAVANRNEDPARQALIRSGKPNIAIFRIREDGGLVADGETVAIAPVTYGEGRQTAPTQVYWSPVDADLLFVSNFRFDLGNDDPKAADYAQRWASEPQTNGNLQWVNLGTDGVVTGSVNLPDVPPAAEVGAPSLPLNVWGHPTERILYVCMVTRNATGVYAYDESGKLTWKGSSPSSGRDVCWIRSSPDGARLYQVGNIGNEELGDAGSSIEVLDIDGATALAPVELQHVVVPAYGVTPFISEDGVLKTGSLFMPEVSSDGRNVFFTMQRTNQTPENRDPRGNYILWYAVVDDGLLTAGPVLARDLLDDGFPSNSRAWGLAYVAAAKE